MVYFPKTRWDFFLIAFPGIPVTRKDNNLGGLIELTNKVIYNNYNRDLHEILKPESLCLTRVDCSKGLLSLGLAFWEYFFDFSQGLKMSFRHGSESRFRNLGHICSWNV